MCLLSRYIGLLFLASFLSSTAVPSLNYPLPLTDGIFEGLHTDRGGSLSKAKNLEIMK